eukprot:3682902-Amphidinium_carterae.1
MCRILLLFLRVARAALRADKASMLLTLVTVVPGCGLRHCYTAFTLTVTHSMELWSKCTGHILESAPLFEFVALQRRWEYASAPSSL